MVDQALLDKLRTVCSSLESSRGAVNLFAIFKMDELTDKWTVVVSAPWVSEASFVFEAAFSELRTLLIEALGEEMGSIARIGFYTLDNHFTSLVMQKFTTDRAISEAQQINGNLVHEGYVVKAIRPAEDSGQAAS